MGQELEKELTQSPQLLYTLSVKDEGTDEVVGIITAYSFESLEEQYHKIEKAAEIYQRTNAALNDHEE